MLFFGKCGCVAASQPRIQLTASLYAHNLHLIPPPHVWGPGSVNQHSSHVDGQTGQHSQFTCPVYIYPRFTPIKPVHSEPLPVTKPVVISTCTVLVGTVESVPVPPQVVIFLLGLNS